MYNRLLAFLFFLTPTFLAAQDIDLMMQAWYWDYFQGANFGNWVNQLNSKTTELKNAGFKHIWLPPLPRTSTPNNQSNGYNPKDLYDFGDVFGGGTCAWGTRAQLTGLINNYTANNMNAVSDVVFNHRDGGRPERNNAVKTYIETGVGAAYPSDRFFCVLPLGSANPGSNGAGDYYLKIKSRSEGYSSNTYRLYVKTSLTAYNPVVLNESEPNGGGDCGQPFNVLPLGQDMNAQLGASGGCHIDEFKFTLTGSNFNTTDDTLFIYMTNTGGGYSDHFVHGLWSASRSLDLKSEVQYWSYTDFTGLPSGQGSMNFEDFRPNTATAGSETMGCDWNCPLFFYDYDQEQTHAKNALNDWAKWQVQTVGIKGLRMDAVKHFSTDYVSQMLNYLQTQGAMPKIVVGEFYDGNPSLLSNWAETVYNGMTPAAKALIKPRIFDFTLRETLKQACEESTDARNVFTGGMRDAVGADPFKIITFINNHDFRDGTQPVQQHTELAYAYILTNNQVGAPCVFYPDYYGTVIPNAPVNNFKTRINNLVALHKTYIYGSADVDYLSRNGTPYYQSFLGGYADRTVIYQMQPNGTGKDVVVAINFSSAALDVYQELNDTWGAISTGTQFTDMLGYSTGGTVTSVVGPAGQPQLHIQLPGHSYTVFVEGVNTPLPVQLVDFQAYESGDDVQLSWSVATERNFDTYEIERSVGDNLNFITIGRETGKNDGTSQSYTYSDKKAPVNTPLYYRLNIKDTDGSSAYSSIEKAELVRKSFSAAVAPNPATEQATVLLSVQHAQDFTITVVNTLGQTIFVQHAVTDSGDYTFELPELPGGLYRIVVSGATEQIVLSLVKK